MNKLWALCLLLICQISWAHEIHCSTNNKIQGWDSQQTYDHLVLYSSVTERGLLISPQLSGAYSASANYSGKLTSSNSNSTSRPRNYVGFDFYEPLADSWFWFYPLLPNKFQKRRNRFTAYIHVVDDLGLVHTVGLSCRMYNNQPVITTI